MPRHGWRFAEPLILDELDSALGSLSPGVAVEWRGYWIPSSRRTYAAAPQSGSGAGPFVDVVDHRWRGTLASEASIAAVAFLVTPNELFWSKSVPPAEHLDVELSLHAYAEHSLNRATFVTQVGGAALPGIAVGYAGSPGSVCQLEPRPLMTERVELLAQTAEATVGVLLLQGQFLRVGRHRLWRMREESASALTPRVRDLLTRRRSGVIRSHSRDVGRAT